MRHKAIFRYDRGNVQFFWIFSFFGAQTSDDINIILLTLSVRCHSNFCVKRKERLNWTFWHEQHRIRVCACVFVDLDQHMLSRTKHIEIGNWRNSIEIHGIEFRICFFVAACYHCRCYYHCSCCQTFHLSIDSIVTFYSSCISFSVFLFFSVVCSLVVSISFPTIYVGL